MIAVPGEMPVTVPGYVPTIVMVATEGLLLLQTPPATLSSRAVVEPKQTEDAPIIGGGAALIETTIVATQPVHDVNDIVAVPAATPVITPIVVESGDTVATDGLLLLHVPQLDATDNVDVRPMHAGPTPVIAGGALTVITVVAIAVPQLFVTAYVAVAVPAAIPVTTPDVAPIVATEGLLLLHAPPLAVLLIVVAAPMHNIVDAGVLPADGAGETVTTFVL